MTYCLRLRLIAVLAACLAAVMASASQHRGNTDPTASLATSFLNLDLESARKQADLLLSRDGKNVLGLFVRMEVAELEAQTATVLDSALRLCSAMASENILTIASGRILEHAGHTPAFHALIPRVQSASNQGNNCSFNLRLALVAAAADGDPSLDLDQAANAAGLLTHWRIAGPFGHYNNADFDRQWPPEADHFSHSDYGKVQAEEFWWRDGSSSLPDYLASAGIFYGAGDIETTKTEDSILRVSSPGPYSVFLDDKLVLAHDSRYVEESGQDSVALKLNAGKHRVTIKFTPDAVPFRVGIQPHSTALGREVLDAGPLNPYIDGLNAYLRDDLPGAARLVQSDSTPAMRYLRALLTSAAEGHSAGARAAWEAVSTAPLIRIKLAEMASDGEFSSNNDSDFTQEVSNVANALPDSEAAQQLGFAILHTEETLQRLVALHPSCLNLSKAMKFFAARGEHEQTQNLEKQLANCAPESLLYPQMLSAAGRHAEAADALLKLLNSNALNRHARRMLIQELLLTNSGREQEAARHAEILHGIAPNSGGFAQLTVDPYKSLDANSSRAGGFTEQTQFYIPFRRSAFKIIQESGSRRFAAGPSVTLLSDKVLEVTSDRAVSIYTHLLVRVLNKDGVSRLGEVSLPRGAELLELRTIKSGGQIIEPELTLQKPTTSMPALDPGDSIEEEFVVRYHNWEEVPTDAAEFTFGSFSAPVLDSRFVLITPEKELMQVTEANNAPVPHVERPPGRMIRSWERKDIAQTAPEPDLPLENQLPFVTVAPIENAAARLRDDLIAATRIGVQVEKISQTFKGTEKSEREKARQLYHFVTSRIQSSDSEWSANSAEETLLNWEGSRTATLLALARATGLKAGLVLARKTAQPCQEHADFTCYATPLVRFWFSDGTIVDADVESSDLPFGVVPSQLNNRDALLAPLTPADETHPLHVSLTSDLNDEKSVADGELFLDKNGVMAVELLVRLGAARGQQVRSLLRRTNPPERQMFFDQIAVRIFPGATAVSGSAIHEDESEQPLELKLRCQVPQVVGSNGRADLDQLVPALGLRELYATVVTRKFPLYIASVLSESTTFHLRLAAGFELHSLPADFTLSTEFGSYSVRFRSSEQQITIHREFQIPVQVIPPQKYEAFANFARQIDEAERGRIALAVHAASASSSPITIP